VSFRLEQQTNKNKEEVMLKVKLFKKEAAVNKECQLLFVNPVNHWKLF